MEKEFKVGDLVAIGVGYSGIVREILSDDYILVELFVRSPKEAHGSIVCILKSLVRRGD